MAIDRFQVTSHYLHAVCKLPLMLLIDSIVQMLPAIDAERGNHEVKLPHNTALGLVAKCQERRNHTNRLFVITRTRTARQRNTSTRTRPPFGKLLYGYRVRVKNEYITSSAGRYSLSRISRVQVMRIWG
eukprot:scaffold27249_cov40-Prasinocladus_malaysianus.AAC.1